MMFPHFCAEKNDVSGWNALFFGKFVGNTLLCCYSNTGSYLWHQNQPVRLNIIQITEDSSSTAKNTRWYSNVLRLS